MRNIERIDEDNDFRSFVGNKINAEDLMSISNTLTNPYNKKTKIDLQDTQ